MYNLKVEAENILRTLHENGYEAYFIGNYPFVKRNNLINPDEKLKIKSIEIITNASLDILKTHFNIVKENIGVYNKYSLIETLIKQNKVNFKIYHPTTYTNLINKKEIAINTINDILNEFSFLIDSILIDIEGNIIDYNNGKNSSLESIESKTLLSNGNFRAKLLNNPTMVFELCIHASNIPYSINQSYLKIIKNNKSFLKYIDIKDIQKYIERILNSKKPSIGMKIIKECLNDIVYDNCKIFDFLNYCTDEDLEKIDSFNSSVDVISRLGYLFNKIDQSKQSELLSHLKLSYENKIMWLLTNFNLINEENYKLAIYNSRESLKNIKPNADVFLLHEMFERLTSLWQCLDSEKIEVCTNIMYAICSRPFFDYQIAYDDDEIFEMFKIDPVDLSEAKEIFIKDIIMETKHPDKQNYIKLLRMSLEKANIL